jgi:hypothetical protein
LLAESTRIATGFQQRGLVPERLALDHQGERVPPDWKNQNRPAAAPDLTQNVCCEIHHLATPKRVSDAMLFDGEKSRFRRSGGLRGGIVALNQKVVKQIVGE